MPKQQRITRADFARLRTSSSKRYSGSYFSLTISPIIAGSGPKFACVVSKKVAKSAVVRNRIRRQCREVARVELAANTKPISLVFYAKKEVTTGSFAGIKKDIQQMLSRV